MYNLQIATGGYESGIVVYGERSIGVFNWVGCPDGAVPFVSPFGEPIFMPVGGDDAEIKHVASSDDVREYLPGAVWADGDEIATDMDITYDANEDIPALWGYGEPKDVYEVENKPYAGDVWEITGGTKIITLKLWN